MPLQRAKRQRQRAKDERQSATGEATRPSNRPRPGETTSPREAINPDQEKRPTFNRPRRSNDKPKGKGQKASPPCRFNARRGKGQKDNRQPTRIRRNTRRNTRRLTNPGKTKINKRAEVKWFRRFAASLGEGAKGKGQRVSPLCCFSGRRGKVQRAKGERQPIQTRRSTRRSPTFNRLSKNNNQSIRSNRPRPREAKISKGATRTGKSSDSREGADTDQEKQPIRGAASNNRPRPGEAPDF